MATIAEISRRAGLAVSSTSDILRGRPGYSTQTRKRVERIAKEINYVPNWFGKSLRGGKSMTIGLLGCLLEDSSAMMKASSIEAAARAHGYQVYVANTSVGALDDSAAHFQRLGDLLARKVDGLIVDYVAVPPPLKIVRELKRQSIPAVYMDSGPELPNRVAVNRMPGIQQAVNHLSALNHRRVAIITTQWSLTRPNSKMQGYKSALRAANIEMLYGADWMHDTSSGDLELNVCELVRERFTSGGNLPTALILFDDLAAAGALRGLYEAGLRVPEDVSVVGFNDVGIAQVTRPALTTVRQPRGEVGLAAFEMLNQLMNDPSAQLKPIEFGCKLVVRESTGPAAAPQSVAVPT